MVTIYSKINKLYTANIYSHERYGAGNGLFFAKGDKAVPLCELPKDVAAELRPIAEEEWNK